jgi:signal transduction histidine kinase/ligand-binding sensor domain-containing protein
VTWLIRWWLLAILIPIPASALATESTNSAWSVRVWQSDDGLPNNNVTGLAQTPDGYLWLATPTCLSRFDGVRFERFSSTSLVPQCHRRVTTLLRSRDGGLWLGLDRGPVLYLRSGSIQVITNGVPDLTPETMMEDDDGGVLICYGGHGGTGRGGILCRIKDGKGTELLPGGSSMRSLAKDNHGHVWFARESQIGMIHGSAFQVLSRLPNPFTRLAAARSGGVWICSGMQLFKCEEGGGLKEFGTFKPEHDDAKPTALLEDDSGAVWIGTSDSGLFRYADGAFEKIPASHPEILSLMEDREQNLWVGTGGGGLDRIQPRTIELEGVEAGLPFETVRSLSEDTHGVIWAVTQNGLLACRTNGRWSMAGTNAGWPGGAAMCVVADNTGAVWIGTDDHKLQCLRDGHLTTWQARDGLASRIIHSLLASKTGDLWIGGAAPESVQRLHAGKLQDFQLPSDGRSIRAMAEDAAGNIWIGTSGGSLLRINHDAVTDETAHTIGESISIRSLYATPDGSLWIGYAGSGLGRFKDGHFARLTVAQGLYDNYISQIVADGRGWLWFGSDQGIFKVREQELDAVADGKSQRVRSAHFGHDEGLESLQANFAASPGAMRSSDNRLWIPMLTALAVINPDTLHENREPPPVLLRQVTVDDRIVAMYGGVMPVQDAASLQTSQTVLRLSPTHHRVEFEFTALNFSAPENIHFRYRLDGFDENWIEADRPRQAIYPRLPAGDYVFHVTACNSDGVWNERPAALAFTVAPFLWQTWWFRLAEIVVFASAIFAIARYVSFQRLRLQLHVVEHQAELDKERARIARDIHDDLGCRLTKIALLTELALQPSGKPEDTTERVRQISVNAREGIQSLDETVWAINPRNDTLPHLIDYIGQFAFEFLQASGIGCRVNLPDHPPVRTIATDVRHNLFFAVKESLNNAVRHSHAKEVWLRIAVDDISMRVNIEDNGQGFERPSDNACEDGLRNMCKRMEDIGGQCLIESKIGAGTRISFVYPWPRQ